VSGWAEEYCVAGSETAGGVGCRVDEAEVGFDFGDAGSEALALEIADEELAEESSGYDFGRAGVEAAWELVGLWVCAHVFWGRFLYLNPTSPHVRKSAYGWPPTFSQGRKKILRVGLRLLIQAPARVTKLGRYSINT